MEDNDPTGYKSSKAVQAKKGAKIDVVSLPKYSMDLNPWDFSLFEDIEGRAAASAPKGAERPKSLSRHQAPAVTFQDLGSFISYLSL